MHNKTCQQCQKPYSTKFGKQKYCSTDCGHAANRFDYWKALEVMWSKIDRNGPGGCWIWTRSTNNMGYGAMWIDRKPMVAIHRFMYQLAHGNIAADIFVLHKCDVPRCCNPAHLYLGTAADNGRDMAQRKRSMWGERGRHAKLTNAQALEIQARFWTNGKRGRLARNNSRELAREFGVKHFAILALVSGRSWKQLRAPKQVAPTSTRG